VRGSSWRRLLGPPRLLAADPDVRRSARMRMPARGDSLQASLLAARPNQSCRFRSASCAKGWRPGDRGPRAPSAWRRVPPSKTP
jgi:hypothetical protein